MPLHVCGLFGLPRRVSDWTSSFVSCLLLVFLGLFGLLFVVAVLVLVVFLASDFCLSWFLFVVFALAVFVFCLVVSCLFAFCVEFVHVVFEVGVVFLLVCGFPVCIRDRKSVV